MTTPIDKPPAVPRQARRDHAFADVVVVHRHPLMRAGIAAALSPALLACDAGGATVPVWSGPVRPRLLVGDHDDALQARLHAPSSDGPDGANDGTNDGAGPRWLIVTATVTGRRVRLAMAAGVTGYVHASCTLEELQQAACAVIAGRRYLCRTAAAAVAEDWPGDALTPREFDVLTMLCTGLDNKSIGLRLGIAPGTIKTHVKTVLHKLNVHSRTQAVIEAMRRDLIDEWRYSSAIDSDCRAQDRTVTSRGGVGNILSHSQATASRPSPRRRLLDSPDGA
ncbi:response regulator transcription factor [Mitsuaria sp. 7]|uniref:response regulator transcription factor n=1 Tax=Mitsuaria sp. 7 TaxID=1658665 RepID=UPI0018D3E36E|nr:response regulator transcription factor [Mitsuaria sp. 7]